MQRGGIARAGIAAILLAVTLTGCAGSEVIEESGPSATRSASPAPASSIDPKALPAVEAYEAFTRASVEAERRPVAQGEKWPDGADFTKHSFDPIKTSYAVYIWDLKSQGVEYRGTPDSQHISVARIDLKASPWPTVTLTDCQTGGEWNEYSIKTGKKVPLVESKDVPPPYLITARMIFYKRHWGLYSTKADKSRTCTA